MTCDHEHRGTIVDTGYADSTWRGCTYEVLVGYVGERALDDALADVRYEFRKARQRHAPMHSGHEGWAVIREELDELWELVRADRSASPEAYGEARQVAAMALAFMLEVAR